MGNSCFFLGHRTAPAELRPVLEAAVERHVTEYGVTCFYVGRYGNFDRLAGRAVLAAKERHPEVTLFLVLPYHPAVRPAEAPAGFDGTFYPFGSERVPPRLAILRADRRMVERCGHLIAWVNRPGTTRDLLDWARRRAERGLLRLENLAEGQGSAPPPRGMESAPQVGI